MTEATLENGPQKPVTRVLFCGLSFPSSHNYTIEYLQKYPFIQVDVIPLEKVPEIVHQYHLCVVKMCRFDSALIAKASQMKLLLQFGVGLEGRVDIEAATRSKIKVARIPGSTTGNSLSCAEHSIYLILGLLRKQKEMDIAVKQRELGVPTGDTLFGKTVLILGFGAIGVDLAKRLRPFGVKILATKRKWPSDESSCDFDEIAGLVDKKGTPENMYEFAGEADIVVTCLSLNRETAGIVDAKFVSSMKKVDKRNYDAVYEHLKTGHLGGLGIDVAWFEPFNPDDPILKLPNVLITPHVGGVTEYSYRSMAKVVGDCALELHEGKPFTVIEFVN
ncbi:formate dehydrogenase [Carex littledalei]|uniref:Formate dehydrogenase n=1 Tax=Carex littledalei TaxID=544730 RepID=A0A833RMP2_9POAL|nr:formate dehydrogenase [Carex littledalei]